MILDRRHVMQGMAGAITAPYNVTNRPVMVFDNDTRLENDPNAGLRAMRERMAS
jgi:hypothetical protein